MSRDYSKIATPTLHTWLRELAENSSADLVSYILIEQELKRRLGVTTPLAPTRTC